MARRETISHKSIDNASPIYFWLCHEHATRNSPSSRVHAAELPWIGMLGEQRQSAPHVEGKPPLRTSCTTRVHRDLRTVETNGER